MPPTGPVYAGPNGISTHTVTFADSDELSVTIPLTWGWSYRVVVIADAVTNGNMIGRSSDEFSSEDVNVAAMQTPVGGFGGAAGLAVAFKKFDLGVPVFGSSGSWSGYRAGAWATPVGSPDPLATVRLKENWQTGCLFAIPACAGSMTWRLEVKNELGVILDPLDGVVVVGEPPGASGLGGPCNCPPFDASAGGTPNRNQPVRNETAGTGDGTTTVFATAFPYVPNSLRVEVAGFVVPVDTTTPSTGSFTVLGAPPTGELVTVSYEAS